MSRMSQKFCPYFDMYYWYCGTYIKWLKQFNPPSLVGSIVVVGVLTCRALLCSICDLKALQINMQCTLIQEIQFYEFELGHNTKETTKKIFYVKDEGIVDHSWAIWWFKKFHSETEWNFLNHQIVWTFRLPLW